MSRLSRKVRRLQRRNSQSHIFFLFLILMIILGLALAARLYAIAPVKIMDSSMTPKFKEHSIHWMCKLPQCLGEIHDQDIVWVALKSGDAMVRNVLAMPGDSIEITDKGIVRTPHRNFKWKNEDSFIQSKTIYIPKAGDTLYFDKLNDVEQDYVLSYLHTHGQKVAVKSSLWQGDREINLDRVGSTKIANRQVSLKEINFLPWQDRYLIELQIRQSEPGNAPIKIKRELFRLKPAKLELNPPPPQALDTSEAETAAIKDSTVKDTVAKDSVAKDSVVKDTASNVAENTTDPKPEEFLEEPLNEIIIEEDCYYLTCSKGASCPDSRELGYFTHNDFIGLYLKWPDRIKDKVVVPAKKLLDKAVNFALSLLATEEEEDSGQNDSETKEDQ